MKPLTQRLIAGLTAVAGVALLCAGTVHADEAPAPAVTDTLKTLEQVCLPALKGADVGASASTAGFRMKHGEWILPIGGRRRIELSPPDTANPHICSATVYTSPDRQGALRAALATWAGAQDPPLTAAPEPSSDGAAGWSTSAWRGPTSAGILGVALAQAPPAQPASATAVKSNVEVSLTPS